MKDEQDQIKRYRNNKRNKMKWKLNDGHDKNKYFCHDYRNEIDSEIGSANVWSSGRSCIHLLCVCVFAHMLSLWYSSSSNTVESFHSCLPFHQPTSYMIIYYDCIFIFKSVHFHFVSFHLFRMLYSIV